MKKFAEIINFNSEQSKVSQTTTEAISCPLCNVSDSWSPMLPINPDSSSIMIVAHSIQKQKWANCIKEDVI